MIHEFSELSYSLKHMTAHDATEIMFDVALVILLLAGMFFDPYA